MVSELESLNQIWNSAWLNKDVALAEKLMADGYVYITPSGQVLEREALLAIIRSPTYQLYSGTRTEVTVRPLGNDAAVVVHRFQGEGTFDGTSFKDDHRCTMVSVRRGSDWSIVLEQCSPNSG